MPCVPNIINTQTSILILTDILEQQNSLRSGAHVPTMLPTAQWTLPVTLDVSVTPTDVFAPAQCCPRCLQTKTYKIQLGSRNLLLARLHSVCYQGRLRVLSSHDKEQLITTPTAGQSSVAQGAGRTMMLTTNKKCSNFLSGGDLCQPT